MSEIGDFFEFFDFFDYTEIGDEYDGEYKIEYHEFHIGEKIYIFETSSYIKDRTICDPELIWVYELVEKAKE